jgi:thymidylate synthase (FAD)
MKVVLLEATPRPLSVLYTAARTCYSAHGPSEIQSGSAGPDEMLKLIRKVKSAGHHSILEHVSCSFGIEGISRSCTHQLVRHRIASYSQQSQRYVRMDDPEWVVPDSIRDEPGNLMLFSEAVSKAAEIYNELVSRGVAEEDARFVLPNACKTNIVVTMNLRELMHASGLRLCYNAQWEIRGVFEGMARAIATSDELEWFAASMRPKCFEAGKCDEVKPCRELPYKTPEKYEERFMLQEA